MFYVYYTNVDGENLLDSFDTEEEVIEFINQQLEETTSDLNEYLVIEGDERELTEKTTVAFSEEY